MLKSKLGGSGVGVGVAVVEGVGVAVGEDVGVAVGEGVVIGGAAGGSSLEGSVVLSSA